MTRRIPTSEEQELLDAALKDVRPLKGRKPVAPKAPARKIAAPPPPASSAVRPRAEADAGGIDGRTAERLRRGQLEPEAKLDLHGLTEARAHTALIAFLRSAQGRGLRLVLIVTGKGGKANAPDEPYNMELDKRSRGILKALTPRWLREPALARFVAATREAHRRHGGSGALYVYLRKP